MFRGREQAHPERGRDLLTRLHEDLDGLADIESKPLQEGRNMSMLLGPSKEASKEAAKKESEKASGSEDSKPAADAVPDHPQAVVPDHPQAIATTPEDLAEAAESAKKDVSGD